MNLPRWTVLLLLPLSASAAEPQTVLVRVVAPDGKPVTDAKVWMHIRDFWAKPTEKQPVEPSGQPVDAQGVVKLTRTDNPNGFLTQYLYARSGDNRISGEAWNRARPGLPTASDLELPLVELTKRAGQVLKPDGKPAVGVTVTPVGYSQDPGAAQPNRPYRSIALPSWEQVRLATKTDSEGRFQLACVKDYRTAYRITAPDLGETKWLATPNVDFKTQLPTMNRLTIVTTGIEPASLKGRSVSIRQADENPSAGIQLMTFASATFDATGRAELALLPVGKYKLNLGEEHELPNVLEKNEPFMLTAGPSQTVSLKFGPVARVTGTVVSADTGKGLAGASLMISIREGPNEQVNARQRFVTTDKDGRYTATGPAGWYTVWLSTAPDGYTFPNQGNRAVTSSAAKVAVHEKHEFAAIKLITAVTFTGRVLMDGKPVASAEVGQLTLRGRAIDKTDADGKFTLKNLAPDDTVSPRIRKGNAVNVPDTYELANVQKPVTIEIGEANAVTFAGRVMGSDGKPVVGATVRFQQYITGVGRASSSGMSTIVETSKTDAEGRYTFAGYWAVDRYTVFADAVGYMKGESRQTSGTAGQTTTLPDIKLGQLNIAVSGKVLRADGQPLADVELFSVDGPQPATTQSKTDGTFTLTGLPSGSAFLIARKTGYYARSVAVTPGKTDRVTLTLTPVGSPAADRLTLSPEYRAAQEKLTRHLLTQMWDSRATTSYGGSAIDRMAHLDQELAKSWRDAEKKRTDGKTDYTAYLNAATREKSLAELAKQDLDDAFAQIAPLKLTTAYTEYYRLGTQLLPTDKAKALRCAEEAVVKARQTEPPSKMWYLVEAGDLALRAGGKSGVAVIAEAAEMAAAATITPNSRESMYVGLVAARVAPHDWPKAEALLNRMTDPGDYNRYLSATVGRLARTDFPRARTLLEQFKPSNGFYHHEARIRVALAIADTKPDEALKIVESIEKGPFRAIGMIQLATRWGTSDRDRAIRTMDTAFDFLEQNRDAFQSWVNLGGRCGVAMIATVRANEMGYPNVPSLVARSLAMVPTAEESHGPKYRERNIVKLASVLALVDPTTARHLLTMAKSPEEVVKQATIESRDWLFAVALTDPVLGQQLVDKLFELRLGKGPVGGISPTYFRQMGLIELSSTLTAKDQLKDLLIWVSLSREIDDRNE